MKEIFTHDVAAAQALRSGETVLLSGTVYTARDCAHKRMFALIRDGQPLPFMIENAAIYYAGPCPTPKGKASGSCGPTTAARMDAYSPLLLDMGLKIMIGKGERSAEVIAAVKRNRAVYFAAIGGAGAIYGNAVKKSELIAFPDLLSEAVYRLEIDKFPAVVAIDADGNSIFK